MTQKEETNQKKKKESAQQPSTPVTSVVDADQLKVKQPTAADLLKSEVSEIKIRRAKGSKNIYQGICHISASFNNTQVCFTDNDGAVISWSSAGKCNFKGSRKSTVYAAQMVAQDAARAAMAHGMKEVSVRIRGAGLGRDAVRALQTVGLAVLSIDDCTPWPHNGCRRPKPRRV